MTRPTLSIWHRFATALVACVLSCALLPATESTVRAQQPPAKKDEAAAEEEAYKIPAPRKIADHEWLETTPFDRIRLSVEMPDRTNKLSRLDKSRDGKISKEEWPDTERYPFENLDWNQDGFLVEDELFTIAVDVLPLDQRPLQLTPNPGQTLDPMVQITLYEEGREELRQVRRSTIKDVVYFEDMVLATGEKYVQRGELNLAFEFYDSVASQQPNWRGLHQKLVDFWYAETQARMRNLEYARAINLLHEMKQYCIAHDIPEHPQAKNVMGFALKGLVDKAFDDRNYRMGRPYLYKLEEVYPEHDVARELRARFVRESENLRRQAKQREAAGQLREASQLILHAADIWPNLETIDEDLSRIFQKYPILNVAVHELPNRFAPWAPPGTPDARVAQLLHVPLMEVTGVGENTQFSSRILSDAPDLAELGRRITLRVRPGLRWSDGERAITASDVARSLSVRCDPSLPSYDAALASVLKEVRPPSNVYELVVELRRTQLRPQTIFLFNLAAGHRLLGDRFDPNAVVGAGPFRSLSKGSEANMQANQHFFGGQPKISEIVERRYNNGRDAVTALLAGDVALLEQVPPRELRRIEAKPDDYGIVRGAVPALHAISFDFRTRREFKESRALRRAMVYAINRKEILDGALLDAADIIAQRQEAEEALKKLEERKDQLKPEQYEAEQKRLTADLERAKRAVELREGNEIVNGPFPRGTYAFEPSLESWPYDPVLAKGLVDAAKKELGVQTLRFKLRHPDTEIVRDVCRFIKEYWRVVGIDVDLEPQSTQSLEEEVAVGRRFELVYRVHYVRDPVLDAARVLCLGQPISAEGTMANAGSGWLRQNLRELEFATNWGIARTKLQMLQQQARDDVAIIPLWQLNDYHAYHKRLNGVVDNSLGIYQDAENWQIEPWYRKDSN